MSEDSDKYSPLKVLELLNRHGVEYLLVGGQAEVLMGSPRLTYDTDVAYARSPENLERLAAALREVNARLRVKGEPVDLPFQLDATALAFGSNFTFSTDVEDLDLLGYVEPIGTFEDLMSNHELYDLAGLQVKTIGLDDLIRVKEHISRPKDKASLAHLRAIKEVREQRDGA